MKIATENNPHKKKIRKLKKRLAAAKNQCRQAKKSKASGLKACKLKVKKIKEKLNKLKAEASSVKGKNGGRQAGDELSRIEGIGPKIQALLNSEGIYTFRKLSRMRLAELKSILCRANFHFHNPATWATQARLAAAGRWEDLERLQQKVKTNRRRTASKRIVA